MASLASVYHKPAGTFIGLGRIGADSVQKREECVFINSKLSFRIVSYTHFIVFRTTNSPQRRRCKLSQQANKLRTFSTLTTSLQINHPDWPLHKFPPPYLQPRTLSRALHQTHSTTLSPSLETWAPYNRHQLRWPQQTCLVHRRHCNLNRNRTHLVDWDWVVWLPLLRSLHRHRNRRKRRRKICWASSRAVCLCSVFIIFARIVASLV